MERTILLVLLFGVFVRFILQICAAVGDGLNTDTSGCVCSSSFDDIKTKIAANSAVIPVCGAETVLDFAEAIDVSDKIFRLFTANCDGTEDKSAVTTAVFSGERFFSTNTASHHDITLSNVKFQKYGIGSSIETFGEGTLEVLGCTFEGMLRNEGNAISNGQNATVSVSGCTFHGHDVGKSNGGAILNTGQMAINDSTFSRNRATNGGAIYNRYDGQMTIKGSTFSRNHAYWAGGAVYNALGVMAIESSTFSENQANSGGALFYGEHNASQALFFGHLNPSQQVQTA
mmetsp:Transcript_39565/g.58774  ORF Transcript_39565/g.58774 Transcript_39565/m.58774 type:complete len:287 (-) Transcript_39565:604-1464(-)